MAEDLILHALPIARVGLRCWSEQSSLRTSDVSKDCFNPFRQLRSLSSPNACRWVVWNKNLPGKTELVWIPPTRKALEREEDYVLAPRMPRKEPTVPLKGQERPLKQRPGTHHSRHREDNFQNLESSSNARASAWGRGNVAVALLDIVISAQAEAANAMGAGSTSCEMFGKNIRPIANFPRNSISLGLRFLTGLTLAPTGSEEN
jgi:hypothetical protein